MPLPAYNGYRDSAAQNAATSTATEIAKAVQACATINTYSDCLTGTLNVKGTISQTCTAQTSSGMSGECHLGYKAGSTNRACISAHVKGVGGDKNACVGINTMTGQVDAVDTTKYCHSTNGVCT